MARKVSRKGRVIETRYIGGVAGQMPVLSTDVSDAKVDFAGYIYKEKEIDGIAGRMPVVATEGGSAGNPDWSDIEGKPTSTPAELDAAVAASLPDLSTAWFNVPVKIGSETGANATSSNVQARLNREGNLEVAGYYQHSTAHDAAYLMLPTDITDSIPDQPSAYQYPILVFQTSTATTIALALNAVTGKRQLILAGATIPASYQILTNSTYIILR